MSHQYTFKSLLLLTLLNSNITICFAQKEVETDPIDQEILNELSLENLYELPFVEIATGTAVPLEKAPSVATLITATDIQAMGANTINEVLESVPGLHIIPSTLNRTAPVYSIRGLYSANNPQILFLLNGHRIISDLYTSGVIHISQMNVENISRIEVIRGPGSAIYGADAYSGVANIITKNAKELDGFHMGARAGSNNTQNIWSQYGGRLNNNWEIALNFEFFTQDADRSRKVYNDQQSNFDALFGTNASIAPSYIDNRFDASTLNIHLNNKNWSMGLDGYFKRDSGVGAGAAQAIDHQGKDSYDQYLLTLGYKENERIENWKLAANISYFYSDASAEFTLFPEETVLPIGNDGNLFTPHNGTNCNTSLTPFGCITRFSDGVKGDPRVTSKIPSIDLTGIYEGWNNHIWRFNAGAKQEKMTTYERKNFGPGILNGTEGIVDASLTNVSNTPFVYAPDKDRTIKYLSLQDIWELNIDWTLTAGVRYDDYSDFGSTINPRVALVWTATDKLIAKLLYGTAFRAPSFQELYSQNNPIVLGNRNLDPETIKTTELALSYELANNVSTGVSIYYYNTKDMIEFIANADGSSTAQNSKDLTGKGIELDTTWRINKQWNVSANYTYQSTKNNSTHKQIAYVPKQQFFLDARWKFQPDWELSSQLNWVANREREQGDSRTDIDNYTLVNMTLRRKNISLGGSKARWELAASIKNLFDEDAYEPSNGVIINDHPLNERRIYAEIRYHLGN